MINIQKINIRDAIANACAAFRTTGIDTQFLDAQLLLSFVLNTTRTALIAKETEPLSPEDQKHFYSLIERRINGECTAYITGKKEFWGLDFLVNPSVLVPRPDTEILVEAALQKKKEIAPAARKKIKIMDLCTGCGAIAIALKHEMPEIDVCAADISAEALETAKANASRLLPTGSQIHFYHGNLFKALPSTETLFDIIVSNPPYIPSDEIIKLPLEVQNEPLVALDGGKSGLDIIECIIKEAPDYLMHGGMLLLEADPSQMENIKHLLETRGFSGIQLHKDLSNQVRVISGRHEK